MIEPVGATASLCGLPDLFACPAHADIFSAARVHSDVEMTMGRFSVAFLVLVTGGLAVAADEPAKSAAVKKFAEAVGDATLKGDYGKVVDHTCDGLVKELGGRAEAIKTMEALMKQMKAQGITFKSYKVGDARNFLTEGDKTFVVVPTTVELTIPGGKVIGKSYLLGISPDDGKTWKFADGSGLDDKAFRARVLPKLPAKLKLPEKQKPEVMKDK